MRSDYKKLIAEFWPTIMQAWDEHSEKHPVIECDVVIRKVAAMPAKDYIDGLTDRTRKAALRTYKRRQTHHRQRCRSHGFRSSGVLDDKRG